MIATRVLRVAASGRSPSDRGGAFPASVSLMLPVEQGSREEASEALDGGCGWVRARQG